MGIDFIGFDFAIILMLYFAKYNPMKVPIFKFGGYFTIIRCIYA